jgi:hypothetical protein
MDGINIGKAADWLHLGQAGSGQLGLPLVIGTRGVELRLTRSALDIRSPADPHLLRDLRAPERLLPKRAHSSSSNRRLTAATHARRPRSFNALPLSLATDVSLELSDGGENPEQQARRGIAVSIAPVAAIQSDLAVPRKRTITGPRLQDPFPLQAWDPLLVCRSDQVSLAR